MELIITANGMKKIIVFCFCVLFALVGNAQVKVRTSQLVGVKWKETLPESKWESITMSFTETAFTDSAYNHLLEKSSTRSFDYYVTDELPSYTEFHADYVGKEREGCYIVIYNDKVKEVDYYTVMSFTDDELLFYSKAKEGEIPGIDVYIKYERIR